MRLDKYLKVSRLIKRRTVANEACDAGRVLINDRPAKASADPVRQQSCQSGSAECTGDCEERRGSGTVSLFVEQKGQSGISLLRGHRGTAKEITCEVGSLHIMYQYIVWRDFYMEEKKEVTHSLHLEQRGHGLVTGVTEMKSFDEENIFMETSQGTLAIRGSSLHVCRLELEKGEAEIEGKVDSLILKRLFQ